MAEGPVLRRRGAKNDAKPLKIDPEYHAMVMKRLENTLDEEVEEILWKVKSQIKMLKNRVIYQVETIDVYNQRQVDAFGGRPIVTRNAAEKENHFHDKVFQIRDSLLTELFRVPHIRTIYHIFIAFLVNLIINTTLQEYVKEGQITIGFRVIYWSFKDFPIAVIVWCGMQLATFFVYYCFVTWATVRLKAHSNMYLIRTWDITFICLMLLYHGLMCVVPTFFLLRLNLSVPLSFGLLMEEVRFMMKAHSFVRICGPRMLGDKNSEKSTAPQEGIPSFKKFLYFLFVPTLIYRDEYPRTSHRRWTMIAFHILEVGGVICFLAFLYENYIYPLIQDFGKTRVNLEDVLVIFFGVNVPSLLYFLCGFYLLLHCWLNLSSEILCFGDKMFYQDWWNSRSFPEYYKKWNVVVHDWLYAFIYRDATVILKFNRAISTWLVFIISALFHEFILAFTFRFCYPILFVVFGFCSTCLYFIPPKFFKAAGNFILWLMIIIGVGFCGCMYFLEYFARINCPQSSSNAIVDFIVPRSWTCNNNMG